MQHHQLDAEQIKDIVNEYIVGKGFSKYVPIVTDIKALTKSRVHNGDMVLSGARGSVLSIVTISKMNEVFTMTETVEDAVEKFKK